MARFDSMTRTALRLIAKNGQTVTWRQINPVFSEENPLDPLDPVTFPDWNPQPEENVDFEVKIAFLPRELRTERELQLRKDTEQPKNLLLAYMGQVDFEPSLRDVVIRGDKEFAIDYIEEYDPNGEGVILYVMGISS